MTITILTLFPQVFSDIFSSSIIGRAQKRGLVTINIHNIRDSALNKHKTVDDKPYGGGVGMLLRVDVMERAIEKAKALKTPRGWQAESHDSPEVKEAEAYKERVVLLDPKGKLFTQAKARQYSRLDHLILVCGHYEGIDTRIEHFVDESISVGKYILTGGEIPAMTITDAVVRLLPEVLTKKQAIIDESFSQGGCLEAPQYTRPAIFKGYKVPEILSSGNHRKITQWRQKQAIHRTKRRKGQSLK